MILANYQVFLDHFFNKLEELGIDVANLELDHIAYQTQSDDDYDQIKPEFKKIGKEMSEAIVGGRRVGIFQLNSPLQYKGRSIPAVELIAPKTGQVCVSALEHGEFVIKEDFESFVKKYPRLAWDTSKVHQPVFPMITLKLDDGVQVKFHYQPVLDIVKKNGS
ncbi:MAG: hypothetical protein A2804_03000 [Candidatus Pacebacteria bacterium RIFCSPHIGHO2_01_FULL_46_10]|nr:MAG: hypothetical protein A2804_03000 [Candidatus Pacebacteria bacterium RIFCSPHIGHO2_01_FULL_46_10]